MTQMKKLLKYETTKLFYNKYLYSLSVNSELTPIFRNKNFKYACTVLDKLQADFEAGRPLIRSFGRYEAPILLEHFLDARNSVLILTTNLGAADAEKNTIGFGDEVENDYEDTELKRFFAPEFRNRLDGIITFGSLGKEVMMKIVGKFLVELKAQVKD